MRLLSILLITVCTVHSKLTCTKCPFHISPKGHTKCTETCEGDVCHIVVNRFFNGTIIAGCINLHEGDEFKEGPAVCHRAEYRTSCACTTKDKCNDPTSPIANFKFSDKPILEGYQLTPMVGGGGSGSGEDVPMVGAGVKPSDEHFAPSPNGLPVDGLSTPKTIEIAATGTTPSEIIVTKTVALQIADNEHVEDQQTSAPTSPPRDDSSDAQGGNKTTSSSMSGTLSLAIIVGSLAILAPLMVY
ncbi:unnamed protein product [Heligmosomoides polygyrus]|uniref:Activin_recp domain-containing protein n=1 Tax=Heligmosomoides polygyrus TaxID=6339 RepID=A0A3P7X186_HELPZ|nr:unnamed protein product [Heligmosomoides polygyrus]